MIRILETCETCLYFKTLSSNALDGLCVKKAPRRGTTIEERWPATSMDCWCGGFEKQNTQCKDCEYGDCGVCNISFFKYYDQNPDSEITLAETARFERNCFELTGLARRTPCEHFIPKGRIEFK